MKFSSWLALGALIGRETCAGDRNWKDGVLAAIIAKNEVLDRDGVVRKLAEQGVTDGEINELNGMLDQELSKQQNVKLAPRKRGFWASFKRGFEGKELHDES